MNGELSGLTAYEVIEQHVPVGWRSNLDPIEVSLAVGSKEKNVNGESTEHCSTEAEAGRLTYQRSIWVEYGEVHGLRLSRESDIGREPLSKEIACRKNRPWSCFNALSPNQYPRVGTVGIIPPVAH